MASWSCAACGAEGSEFDAQCRACGAAMPALSIDEPEAPSGPLVDPRLGLVVGHHRLVARIGRGGMGVVYRAEDRRGGGEIAVKFLSPELAASPRARARFAREARSAAQIESPHVVRVLDHGVADGSPYIAMELLHGEDLAARLARVGRLSPAETCALVGAVGRGLAAAHAAGIVHRDLKPENVFLARDEAGETVKILDFGIAKDHAAVLAESAGTQSGTLLGTPHYMSPEQADGTRSVDSRTDLWSLAVITFQCLTGRLPFESAALGDLLMKIMSHPLPMPSSIAPELAPGLDVWWSRAAARRAADRFADAGEMVAALTAALAEAPGPLAAREARATTVDASAPSGADAATGPRPAAPRRRPGLTVAAVAAALLAAGSTAWLAARAPGAPASAAVAEQAAAVPASAAVAEEAAAARVAPPGSPAPGALEGASALPGPAAETEASAPGVAATASNKAAPPVVAGRAPAPSPRPSPASPVTSRVAPVAPAAVPASPPASSPAAASPPVAASSASLPAAPSVRPKRDLGF